MNDNTNFSNVDLYIQALTAQEDNDLLTARHLISQYKLPDQSISAVQGRMLQVFAKACGAKRILELGTFCGYSTLWLAKALPEDGRVVTLEYEEAHAGVARQNFCNTALEHKIEVRTGRAIEIMKDMVQDHEPPFDMIFIDADKPPYLEYFKMAVQLSRKGSIIVCDNVIRAGKILESNTDDAKVLGVQRLNNYLQHCTDVTATILQTVGTKEHDGMLLAVVN